MTVACSSNIGPSGSFLADQWKMDHEECPLSWTTIDRDDSLMVLDNTIGDGKTKTCPGTYLFSGEERIKNALLESFRDARTCITHPYFHHVRMYSTADADHFVRH